MPFFKINTVFYDFLTIIILLSHIFPLSLQKKTNGMRFYKEFYGFIFEFNSWGEYFRFLFARFLGMVAGIVVVILLLMFFGNYK
jgi:hypothetical protein